MRDSSVLQCRSSPTHEIEAGTGTPTTWLRDWRPQAKLTHIPWGPGRTWGGGGPKGDWSQTLRPVLTIVDLHCSFAFLLKFTVNHLGDRILGQMVVLYDGVQLFSSSCGLVCLSKGNSSAISKNGYKEKENNPLQGNEEVLLTSKSFVAM